MKYLVMILSLVALIGTATAQTTPTPKETGSKGKECCTDCCCCKK